MKNCDQIRESMPAYVAGNLEDGDRSDVEAHVAQCAGCSLALENLNALTTLLHHAPLSPEPSPGLERHVFSLVRHDRIARLAEDAPLAPEPPSGLEERALAHAGVPLSSGGNRKGWQRVSLALTPALGLAAILLAVFLITSDAPNSTESPIGRPSGHFLQEIRLTGAGEADLALTHFRQDNYRLTLTDTDQLPPLSEGHHYELWLTGDDGHVSAGNFRYVKRDDFAIDFNIGVDPAEYNTVEITEEPDDGDPGKTGDKICGGWFDPGEMRDF